MSYPYSEKVLDHFKNPRNTGELENPDAKVTEGSSACGDYIKLSLKVNHETKVIEDIRFKSYGCASNIATASIITEMAKGKTLDEAKSLTWEMAAQRLDGLPPVKVHCAVLAVNAVRAAIENYEQQHGLMKEKKATDEKTVSDRLKHVINPLTGLDVMQVNFVTGVSVKEGVIEVRVNLNNDHQFAGSVREEIKERLEPLWDIKQVNVVFNND
jgi:NifU-like protein involved in Fe-S cluster formation/metal-sulfur cluster biosynthetic enzyme